MSSRDVRLWMWRSRCCSILIRSACGASWLSFLVDHLWCGVNPFGELERSATGEVRLRLLSGRPGSHPSSRPDGYPQPSSLVAS